MKYVDIDPKTDFVFPIGLYSKGENTEDHEMSISYPVSEGNKWGFPDSLGDLKFKKSYFVFSPSIFPTPPKVRFVYTFENEKTPNILTSLHEVYDSFDIQGLQKEAVNLNKKLGSIFGAYRKPVVGTIPLYMYIKTSKDGTKRLLISEEPELVNPVTKIERQAWVPILYVMSEKPKGFELSSTQICVPEKKGKGIDSCTKEIPLLGKNINYHTLGSKTGLDTLKQISSSAEHQQGSRRLFISIFGVCFILAIFSIFIWLAFI